MSLALLRGGQVGAAPAGISPLLSTPAIPSGATSGASTATTWAVSWAANAEADVSYNILLLADGAQEEVFFGLTTNSFTFENLTTGSVTYSFRVQATTRLGGSSAYSTAVLLASTDPYDLGEGLTFTPTWPTAPDTDADINVPADMEFSAAVAISRRRVIVASGYTGAGLSSGWGDDVDVVMDDTAEITSACGFGSAQRIRWTGGQLSGELTANGFTDILIDNLNIQSSASSSATNWATAQAAFSRLAIINCTIQGTGTSGSTGWGIYVRPVTNYTSGTHHTDMIIANVYVDTSNYQGTRIMSVDNLVIVDSIATSGNFPPGGTAWRFHYRCTDVYCRDVIGAGLLLLIPGTGTVPSVLDATFDNWHQYNSTANSQSFAAQTTAPNTGTVQNSKIHFEGGAGSVAGISPMTDGGGNSRVAWDGSTIDYSEMPGKTALADYGADH